MRTALSLTEQIEAFIASQPVPKQSELRALHELTLQQSPECKLWFSDGKNDEGKVVANPTIGYGSYTIHYADGTSRESFRIGLSANKTGISVYIMGLEDKAFLPNTYGPTIGKATVTGYCIRFKSIREIDLETLAAALQYGFAYST